MSSRQHIDDFMRGRIIGKIEEVRKITECCQGVQNRSQRCFTAVKSFKTTGMSSRRHRDVVLKYDACRRQIYRLSAKRNRYTTAQQVANQFLAASGDLPKHCRQTFEEEDIRTQTCCVSH
ncbi:hypothetical protein TNCV_4742831 [Trichonephila clavipes]|nr:hypothetical protein TNCV_4742831 [Trichonephila clavipes]